MSPSRPPAERLDSGNSDGGHTGIWVHHQMQCRLTFQPDTKQTLHVVRMLMDVEVVPYCDLTQVEGLYAHSHTSLHVLWKASGSDGGSPNHNST